MTSSKTTPLMGGLDAELRAGVLRLMLFRHGEAEVNLGARGVIGGRATASPLTERGRAQAEQLARHLEADGVRFDFVFASTAVRARQTAEIVCARLGFAVDRVVLADELLEVDQGQWTGRSRPATITREVVAAMQRNPWDFAPPGGESQRDVELRMVSFVREKIVDRLWRTSSGDGGAPVTVGVFGHGMAIRCFLRSVLGSDPGFTWRIQMDNANVTTLFLDPVIGWRLMCLNVVPSPPKL
jgi:probable phosphoglycerate mutase